MRTMFFAIALGTTALLATPAAYADSGNPPNSVTQSGTASPNDAGARSANIADPRADMQNQKERQAAKADASNAPSDATDGAKNDPNGVNAQPSGK